MPLIGPSSVQDDAAERVASPFAWELAHSKLLPPFHNIKPRLAIVEISKPLYCDILL
jgi:hypothetical protein